MIASTTHLVLIPSFDSGALLLRTLHEAASVWEPVWVVVDGSTDGSGEAAEAWAADKPGIRVIRLGRNQGKGAALRHGMLAAAAAGFGHALTMDADGQHPAARIGAFMAASMAAPEALVMGRPVFGPDAPWIRRTGRRISNRLAAWEAGRDMGDVLCGFRVYPIRRLLAVMDGRRMQRFDFDPEAAVRLALDGVPLRHLPAEIRYPGAGEGGVSHFRYRRDNLLLAVMHARLLGERLLAQSCDVRAWIRRRRPDPGP